MDKKADKLLKQLMEAGYTVNIQAKGRGREFEMTYEVHTLSNSKFPMPLIAFGERLAEALESIQRQIELVETYATKE